MSFRVVATFSLLCSLVAAVDDHTSLMQIKTKVESPTEFEGSTYRSNVGEDNRGPIGDADRMALGKDFTCAMSNTKITCWGNNEFGVLGYGDTTTLLQPPYLSAYLDFANSQLVAGSRHVCAIMSGTGDEGKVKCWGRNDAGQLGTQDTADLKSPSSTPVNLGPGVTAKFLAAGDDHTCAILNNDQVKCWGKGDNGRLGNSNNVSKGMGPNTMGGALGEISLGTGRSAVSIALGAAHTCAILDNGEVKCWGRNTQGQLGYGEFLNRDRGGQANEMGDSLAAVSLGDNPDGSDLTAKFVVCGANHTCVIINRNNGVDRAKCWGQNDKGQLGYSNSETLPAIGVAANQMGDHLQFIDFGTKEGSATNATCAGTPAQCYGVISMAAGAKHTCAILANGAGHHNRVKCWGHNSNGQLGYENVLDKGKVPNTMGNGLGPVSLSSSKYAVAVACGHQYTCALLSGTPNDMKCWGNNNKGQLGIGSNATIGNDQNEMSDNLLTVQPGTTAAP